MKVKTLIVLFLLISALIDAQEPCRMVKISDFPKQDLPPKGFKRNSYKVKESYKYYYGIDVHVDYKLARYMAFREMKDTTVDYEFNGPVILLMLYANGFGVKQDIQLSMRLACGNVGGSIAEVKYRQQHLQDMLDGKVGGVFDICDDITSGLMDGLCAELNYEKAAFKRDLKMDSILKNWPVKDTVAYSKLSAAADNFFQLRSGDEVDESGTSRVAMEMEEQDSLEKNFLDKIEKADKCNFPNYSNDDFIKADKELNLVYRKIMNCKTFEWGTVTQEQIKSVEIKWIKYRDAWVDFGKIRCPEITEDSWKTLLTRERISQLKEFLIGQK